MKKIILFTLIAAITATALPVNAREKTDLELAKEKIQINQTGMITGDLEQYFEVLHSKIDVPQLEECEQMLKDSGMHGVHPRIMATAEDFARVKEQIKTDEFTALLYRKIKEYTDAMIQQPVHLFQDEKGSAPETDYNREVADRFRLLGMMYQLTGDMKYVEFAEKQIDVALQGCVTWEETLALHIAGMAQGIAVAYDWMYDALSEDIKEKMRSYMVSRLSIVDNFYVIGSGAFPNQVNNWNSVCNGAYGVVALTILDEEPELASRLLTKAAKSITMSMDEMAPNGGFPEGPGYWSYQVEYIQYFISALDTALKNDFKLSEFPGFKETAFFPLHIAGPTSKAFNYADVDEGGMATYHSYWFAKKYGYEGLNKIADDLAPSGTDYTSWEPKSLDVLIMLWRTPTDKNPYEGLPEGNVYYGRQNVATLRSEWGNPYATFVGFKGGYNQVSHGNLDIGSFVLDALGTRWVNDLGKEDYALEGYWDYDKGRWEAYTQKAEGHNTIVINLSKSSDQNPYAKAEIIDFKCENDLKYGVVDMSEAYNAGADKAIRGVALCGENVIIKDEITLKKESDVLWGINTTANVEISENKKDAILTLQEKKMKVSIISPSEASFETMPAKSLVFDKKTGEKNIDKYNRLYTRFISSGDVDIAVTFTPFYEDEPEPERINSVKKIERWSDGDIYEAEDLIRKIILNGAVFDKFNSSKPGYVINLKEGEDVPKITAEYDAINANIEIVQADKIGDVAKISLKSLDPRKGTLNYTLKYQKEQEFGKPDHLEEIPIAEITASGDEPKTPIPYVHDGRLDTSWAAQGEQWIMFDFGEVTPVKCIAIAFSRALQRRSIFDIEISEDGENFTQVFSGISTGITMGYERYSFGDAKARYVRINGHQNTVNSYNNYTEVSFFR